MANALNKYANRQGDKKKGGPANPQLLRALLAHSALGNALGGGAPPGPAGPVPNAPMMAPIGAPVPGPPQLPFPPQPNMAPMVRPPMSVPGPGGIR